jgi:methylated-DNA-[protein]-cysteine S-methyltransferase
MSKASGTHTKAQHKPKPRIEDLRGTMESSKRISLFFTHYRAPFGTLYLVVTKQGSVFRVGFSPDICTVNEQLYSIEFNKYPCGEACYQLDQYFAGKRTQFELSIAIDQGTEFEQDVWKRLIKIEYGQTMTYGEIAQKVGRKLAARAVGNAVAKNPIPIIVPCHRVLPASGGLGNYSLRTMDQPSGVAIKKWLLDHERPQI